MGNPLGHKYIPYTYMDPLGESIILSLRRAKTEEAQLSNVSPEAMPELG